MVTLIRVVEVGPERSGWVHDVFWNDCLHDVKCSSFRRLSNGIGIWETLMEVKTCAVGGAQTCR